MIIDRTIFEMIMFYAGFASRCQFQCSWLREKPKYGMSFNIVFAKSTLPSSPLLLFVVQILFFCITTFHFDFINEIENVSANDIAMDCDIEYTTCTMYTVYNLLYIYNWYRFCGGGEVTHTMNWTKIGLRSST